MLNVREASPKQITDNIEINNLKKILGLKQGEKYDKENSIKSLRYGHLMIMADQVKNSLIFLFFHSNYIKCIRKMVSFHRTKGDWGNLPINK